MKAIFYSMVLAVIAAAIATPFDLKFQAGLEAERQAVAKEAAEWQRKIASGEVPVPTVPKWPTDEEVAAYWAARGGYREGR